MAGYARGGVTSLASATGTSGGGMVLEVDHADDPMHGCLPTGSCFGMGGSGVAGTAHRPFGLTPPALDFGALCATATASP
jgi:hypothetical protein